MTVIKNIAKDRILQITVVITIISLFFARPRIEDINFHTLYSILAMLTIIQIFSYLHVLDVLAYKLTASARSTRRLTAIFTILSIVSAMFLTNDITVLTLIPLYLTIAKRHNLPEILPVTLIGMGANIGAAFTPWGNPHNIFVVNRYNVSPLKFFSWSLPLLLVSLIIVLLFIFFVKDKPIPTVPLEDIRISVRPMVLTIAVSIFFFFGVFNIGRNASGNLVFGWNGTSIGNVLFKAMPLILTGLSVALAFKTGLFNIGAPGQYLMGTAASLIVALSIPTTAVLLVSFDVRFFMMLWRNIRKPAFSS